MLLYTNHRQHVCCKPGPILTVTVVAVVEHACDVLNMELISLCYFRQPPICGFWCAYFLTMPPSFHHRSNSICRNSLARPPQCMHYRKACMIYYTCYRLVHSVPRCSIQAEVAMVLHITCLQPPRPIQSQQNIVFLTWHPCFDPFRRTVTQQ